MSFKSPPKALRSAKLDNLMLIPASALPRKGEYQQAANRLPRGQVLLVSPAGDSRGAAILERVASQLKRKGQVVTIKEAQR
jgi:hypothetical protein